MNGLSTVILDIFFKNNYNGHMDNILKQQLAREMSVFRLPRYAQLPDMGLYLEQTVQYVNQCLAPLGCMEITGSMVRNYVKMDLIANPVNKRYHADQIAHIICVTLLKHVMELDYIGRFFVMQKKVYTDQVAYDYFCTELENILFHRFGLKEDIEDVGVTQSLEKEMLRSAITAVSHIIYINACLNKLEQ